MPEIRKYNDGNPLEEKLLPSVLENSRIIMSQSKIDHEIKGLKSDLTKLEEDY